MKKETLYRFFEGKATYDEEKRIREWMERSDNHLVTVIQARKEYDALLLAGYISHTTSPHISNAVSYTHLDVYKRQLPKVTGSTSNGAF